ncbi:putative E3 ubiquitin-protein ligase UBR7 [Homalodisca vitripennis]|uniref:putative E3 ubiquitin-protein ligase UBR7 n=1 Tax=Homalodisca vitripennis TaxID=197043 RepID=UPI001EECD675|nr:putative E3 ubiquitin-protein ligase UBR7 [Homalodisca vitripennis]
MSNDNQPSSSMSKEENDQDNEETIVTMVDVLKAEEILEENADAVLGPGDDKNCTYNEGYLKRQALYSCLTCLPADKSEHAGVCLACSYHCHSDHDLVELYTKRNFRCDCGNSLFNGKKCTLDPIKSEMNENNSYNQNFRGVYCCCQRPYPDPEDPEDDEMIQCVVCEDWFHTRHLDSSVPKEDDYGEMICGTCTDKLPFLQYYLGYAVSKIMNTADKNESSENINVDDDSPADTVKQVSNKMSPPKESAASKTSETSVPVNQENGTNTDIIHSKDALETSDKLQKTQEKHILEDTKENVPENSVVEEKHELMDVPEEEKAVGSEIASPSKESDKCEEKECLLKKLKILPRQSGATFWPEGFRKLLCTCISCMETYKKHNVSFLTDEEDTVRSYEDKGKLRKREAGPTQYERGMEALSSLDRVQQMEAILGYNEMKTHLSEYLAKFAENKKVVREEDIKEFFSGMKARKRQKLDIPYSCR